MLNHSYRLFSPKQVRIDIVEENLKDNEINNEMKISIALQIDFILSLQKCLKDDNIFKTYKNYNILSMTNQAKIA